jgi:dTDP-4-amino-4,6-dideoxygalactose transaminase
MRIPLSVPVLEGNERAYLNECIDSGYVSSVGPFVTRFEEAFAERVGRRYAVACSSGTAALHVALQVSGVRPHDIVAVSDLTFIASANAIAYCGATPLLVDSEAKSWNLDSQQLFDYVAESARRGDHIPRAIEVVHLLGVPADMEPIRALHQQFGIPIIEDAAEALGATFPDGSQVGSVGEFGCFSFNGNKIITSGGGGMVVCDDERLATKARHLTTQARLPGASYQHDEVGFNYRLTNLEAAVGLAQLERLDEFLSARRRVADRYRTRLSDDGRFSFPEPVPGSSSSGWLTSFRCESSDSRDRLLHRLKVAEIESRPIWLPMSTQAPYASSPRVGGGIAADVASTAISVPSSSNLTESEVEQICEEILRD